MSRSGPVVLTVVLPAVPTSLLVPSERPDHLSELLLPFSTLRCRQVPGTPGGGNYGSSNCDTCRGRKSPLGVSMRLCSEKSCVSQRHCPLTDIYPPLSLLFLFSLFLPPSPILPLSSLPHSSLFFSLLSLRLGARSRHSSRNLSRKQVQTSDSWMSLRGSLSALLPQEHFPSSATAAGRREEDEDEDVEESAPASGAENQERRE